MKSEYLPAGHVGMRSYKAAQDQTNRTVREIADQVVPQLKDHAARRLEASKAAEQFATKAMTACLLDQHGDVSEDLFDQVLVLLERPLLTAVMDFCKGNQSKAASILGLNRSTLRKKLRRHRLKT